MPSTIQNLPHATHFCIQFLPSSLLGKQQENKLSTSSAAEHQVNKARTTSTALLWTQR